MTAKLLGPDDEPQQSGAVVAVHYDDYRQQEPRPQASGRRGARSDRAEQRFRDFLQKVDAELLEDEWLGAMYKHRARCVAGHECEVIPNSVDRNDRRGICRVCARQDPSTAEAAFRERIVSLGGTILDPTWLGSTRPHRVRCAAGHETAPTPGNVARGQGICGPCAGNDPDRSRSQFHDRVSEFGGTVVDSAWRGVDAPHAVRCASGHTVRIRPSDLLKMRNLCVVCTGRTPAIAEARFRSRIVELGGEVLEARWLGYGKRHRVRCRAGHIATPRPDHVLSGIGMCRLCAGKTWDVFYVVTDPDTSTLKFGITSGDPRPRLTDHAHDGLRRVELLLTALGDGVAQCVERAVKTALRGAGHRPVRGLEYFHLGVRDSVLATAADVIARGPVTLLVPGDDATYADGWANGRRRMLEQIESLRDDEDVPPGHGWRANQEA